MIIGALVVHRSQSVAARLQATVHRSQSVVGKCHEHACVHAEALWKRGICHGDASVHAVSVHARGLVSYFRARKGTRVIWRVHGAGLAAVRKQIADRCSFIRVWKGNEDTTAGNSLIGYRLLLLEIARCFLEMSRRLLLRFWHPRIFQSL